MPDPGAVTVWENDYANKFTSTKSDCMEEVQGYRPNQLKGTVPAKNYAG